MIRTAHCLFFVLFACSCGESAKKHDDDEAIIFRNASGQVLTKSELLKADGMMNWTVTGGDPIPAQARKLHEQGRRSGEKGDYTNSLSAFKKASQLAPNWPYPIYDIAFTCLLMGRDSDALENYERVDQMDPAGFFTTKTALWALRGEKQNKYPRGTYLSFLRIEWTKDEDKKKSMAKAILDGCPDYAPAWKEFALRTDDPKQKLEAFNRGLAASPDGETFGMLAINKTLFLRSQGQHEQAITILGELALSTNSTRTTIALAKTALSNVIGSK